MSRTKSTEETARAFATGFVAGSFAEAADLLTDDGREAVVESFPEEFREGPMDAEDALERYRRGLYSQYGSFDGVTEVSADDAELTVGGTGATVEFTFEDGAETARIEVGDDGVTGFSFAPEYEPPGYVEESAVVERDATIDAGAVELDGVLAVPDGVGPFPGVVLVHGAGVHDPDGTAGASKVLKDLAWGLASEEIATLRYEKRLAEHDVPDDEFTLDAVVVDDAVAAVDQLAAADEVDESAVFVAGHSQGGMCAPRIATRHGGVAGVVVLDALADPVLDPDGLAFMRYELEPDGDLSEEQEAELERQRETARRLAEGEYDDDETIWGRPGTWHRSVGNYDPAATASSLDAPTFVLKTGRADEETQPELVAWLRDEFEKWQTVDLPNGSRVEFYEAVDHYFQKGFPPAHPLGLYFGGNVDGDVVADLATWVHENAAE